MPVIATPVPGSSASSGVSVDVLRPRYARSEGKPLLTKMTAVVLPQAATPTVEFVIRDDEGRPIDLVSCGFSPSSTSSSSSSGSSASEDEPKVLLRMNEVLSKSTEGLVEVEAAVVDPTAGVVRAKVPARATELAGVMGANWGVFDRAGTLLLSNAMYLVVERNLFATKDQTGGVPTVGEIRTHMRDHKDGNFLLKDFEWDVAEIAEAATAAVSTWNTTPPRINKRYNTANFYDPDMLVDGIMAELYLMAARLYARDHLPYSAGGVQLDDKNKSQEYMAIGTRLQEEFVTAVKMDKARMNREQWAGVHGSPYGGRR
jgi:hypothetical protein